MNVLVSIISDVTLKHIFQGWYCTFNKCRLRLTPSGLNLFSFSFATFFRTLQQFLFPCRPNFSGLDFFVMVVKSARTVSLESFVFGFSLQLQFYQACLDEIVDNSRRYCFSLVYQIMPGPYLKVRFGIWQTLSLFDFTCVQSKLLLRSL